MQCSEPNISKVRIKCIFDIIKVYSVLLPVYRHIRHFIRLIYARFWMNSVYLASAVKTCYLNILETIHYSGFDMWKGSRIQYLNSKITTPNV